MPSFVIGSFFLLGFRQHFFAFWSHQNLVPRVLEVFHSHRCFVVSSCPKRGFIHQVANIGSRKSDCAFSQAFDVHIIAQRNIANMNVEHFDATFERRFIDGNVTIETTGSQQRWV